MENTQRMNDTAGTTEPNKAIRDWWAGMKDSREAQRLYEELSDPARLVINMWASMDPQGQEEGLQIFRNEIQRRKGH